MPKVAATADTAAAPAAASAAPAGDGLISDHEFESLLDELHGKGKFSEVPPAATAATAAPVAAKAAAPAPVAKPAPA
ncbi:chemotaxis protein CheA, partial [Pseudomonas cedrina subsp. fulgida]|nr:chemotaxis protein CheA [Pseudomonas cedrina subsp. fulgida]